MSSQEMKKQEKGNEVVTFEENPSTYVHHHTKKASMVLSEQEIEVILQSNKETYNEKLEKNTKENAEKVGIEEGNGSSSKITPCIFYTSDEKARLRWSSDLHDCFVNAVEKLGGPNKATPKSVKEAMEVEGIALHHVKSHLQKFRLGKCNIRGGTNQYVRRFKTAREIRKTCASLNSHRPQVNIQPRLMGAVKPKPKKEKEVQGSLYMLIENDLRLQRCREEQRMQKALATKNQGNMFETQHLKASMTSTLPSQHNKQEQWFVPFSYHFSGGQTNPFTMNYSQLQPSITIPQNTTSVEDFCNDGMACLSLSELNARNTFPMYEASIHPTQGNLQFNDDNQSYNMAQSFINPYMSIESQSMPHKSQQQLQLNNDCVNHDSYCNATFLSVTVPPTIDSLHQDTLNNTILFPTTLQAIPTSVSHNTYMSSYPSYNTVEVVKAQLNALQDSSTSQTQETFSRETNLSSIVTRDEADPVDKYIDWNKVGETDIEHDSVEVLEALGLK